MSDKNSNTYNTKEIDLKMPGVTIKQAWFLH